MGKVPNKRVSKFKNNQEIAQLKQKQHNKQRREMKDTYIDKSTSSDGYNLAKHTKKIAKSFQQQQNNSNDASSAGADAAAAVVTKPKTSLIQEAMKRKLEAAKFRMLNEKMYNITGREAKKMFDQEPALYETVRFCFGFHMSFACFLPHICVLSFIVLCFISIKRVTRRP